MVNTLIITAFITVSIIHIYCEPLPNIQQNGDKVVEGISARQISSVPVASDGAPSRRSMWSFITNLFGSGESDKSEEADDSILPFGLGDTMFKLINRILSYNVEITAGARLLPKEKKDINSI